MTPKFKTESPYKIGDKVLTTIGKRKGKKAHIVDFYFNPSTKSTWNKNKGWVFLVRFTDFESGWSELYEWQILHKA